MLEIVRITTPEGLSQFKSPSEDLMYHQALELNRINSAWRDLQTIWPESRSMFPNNYRPYQQYCVCREYLQRCERSPEINLEWNTRQLKHHVEETTHDYVGQGYLALAAYDLGFMMRLSADGHSFSFNIVVDDDYWYQLATRSRIRTVPDDLQPTWWCRTH